MVPEEYVQQESLRPRLAQVVAGGRIPVVDLGCPDRAAVVSAIGDACRSDGFFQVLNHGIDAGLMAAAMAVAREFFRLPPEEKAKLYSDDPARKMRLSTSFNVRKETVRNWRDYLRLHCHPLDQFVPDWPSNPPDFKETMSTYYKQIRELGFRLHEAISESLGLEAGYIGETLGAQEEHMAVNYYPPCPVPDPTYGLPEHTEPNALTILLMDHEVAGLQVLNGGKWVAAKPQPGALVVNIGDQQPALSNEEYRNVWHRAVVNSDRKRMSVAEYFLSTPMHHTVPTGYIWAESQRQRHAEVVVGAHITFVNHACPGCDGGKALGVVAEVQKRDGVVAELERSFLELQQAFNDMAALVAVQGEQLDVVEGNVDRAHFFVHRGCDQLQEPRRHQRSSRNYTCIAILILLVIIHFIHLPIVLKKVD